MGTVFNFSWCLFRETEVGFVNQGSALQGVVGTFAPEMVLSDSSQLIVNKGNDRL